MPEGRVTVLLFGPAREAAGRTSVVWEVPAGGLRAEEVVAGLRARYPRLGPTLDSSRYVRNGRYLSTLTTRLRPGDEFAVHPPYGGG